MKSPLAFLAALTILAACEPSESLIVYGSPAYLYDTFEACEWSRQVGPGEAPSKPIKGVLRQIPAGTTLPNSKIQIGKDMACYDVEYQGIRGFVMYSCGRVNPVGQKCRSH